jgi:hypothetical protein
VKLDFQISALNKLDYQISALKAGHMVGQLVETLRYKSQGCGFDP